MKKKLLIFTILILMIFLASCVSSKTNTNIHEYLSTGTQIDQNAKDIMPDLVDLPPHQSISYTHTHRSLYLFESDSAALIVQYDDDIYQIEEKRLTEQYNFLDKIEISEFDESKFYIPEVEFNLNSYTFKVIDEAGTKHTDYPKSFGMIGFSDEQNRIAYLYFYDFDLDYIKEENTSQSMADFVQDYFDVDF